MKVKDLRKAKIMRRKRVEGELNNLFDYPLTIVSATMGYGKTTAVRTYLSRKKNIQTVWISLLGSDGDEIVFWHKVCVAIGRFYPDAEIRLERLGFPSDVRKTAAVIEQIWKLDHSESTVIVIDDYHLIEHNQNLNRFVEFIAEEEIPNLHIILLSRTRPKFNHSNILSKGLGYYIDTDKLAFTLQEIKDYIDHMGDVNITEDIEKIYYYTHGWISAIYLILLGCRQGLSVTDASDITQLVGDNLYAALDKPIQEALLNLSVLDSFTLNQATQILDNPRIPQYIGQLMEQNAFIEFDQQTGIYKLHNVLLDFLREKTEADGWNIETVCYQAGKWFIQHNDDISAFDYYYRAGRIEELLAYLNSIEKLNVGYFLGVNLLKKIYKELSTELYIKYPFPLLRIAFSFILSGEPAGAEQCAKIIDQLEKYYSKAENASIELRGRILGEIEIINIFRVFNHAEKMVELSVKADKLLKGGVSYLVFRKNEFTFGIPYFLYAYYRKAGELKNTLDCIEKGFPPKVFDGCGTGCEYVAFAEYYLETGDIQNAEFFAKKAIYKAKTMQQTGIILCAYFTLMRVCLLQGNISAAKELAVRTRTVWLINPQYDISLQNTVIYNSTMDMFEGYLYGTLNLRELIPKWLQTGELPFENLMMQGLAFPYIIYTKAVLLTQNWVELEVLCETVENQYRIYHNQLGLLHNAIYASVAKYNLYGLKAGMITLRQALKEAQMDGILLPFAENATFILPMLYEIQKEGGIDPFYLDSLIGLSEQYQKNLKVNSSTAHLTERELQVINLLAQGLTNREMADRLYLSVASIKKHLENIYSKLGVNNKVSAVQKAQHNKYI